MILCLTVLSVVLSQLTNGNTICQPLPNIELSVNGNLFCFQGPNSGNVLPKPVECLDGTTECYKYECEGEIPFTTRGCGLSFETLNLWNDSCGQARSICETLNQQGTCLICDHKHMCNGGSSSRYFLTIIYAMCNLLYFSL